MQALCQVHNCCASGLGPAAAVACSTSATDHAWTGQRVASGVQFDAAALIATAPTLVQVPLFLLALVLVGRHRRYQTATAASTRASAAARISDGGVEPERRRERLAFQDRA